METFFFSFLNNFHYRFITVGKKFNENLMENQKMIFPLEFDQIDFGWAPPKASQNFYFLTKHKLSFF